MVEEAKDLRKAMQDAEDKFAILADREVFNKYEVTVNILLDVIKEFLSDSEKIRLFELGHIEQQSSYIKKSILETILDENLKIQTMSTLDLGLGAYEVIEIVRSFSDDAKTQILHNQEFVKKFGLQEYDLARIISSLSEENRVNLLLDVNLISGELGLMSYQLIGLVTGIKSEEDRLKIVDTYREYEIEKFDNFFVKDVLSRFSDEGKISIVLENKYGFNSADLTSLIATFGMDRLVEFLNVHKEFLEKNNIVPYKIAANIGIDRQPEFARRIDDLDLSVREKKLCLVSLKNEVKAQIDTSSLPEEYKVALRMKKGESFSEMGTFGKVIVDLNSNLEDYRDFDEFIVINPMEISEEDKDKLFELCDICPNISITDNIGLTPSTAEEYKRAEMWIDKVIDGMNPNWTDIQKVAYIDNQIGQKISYTPDFDTEVCNLENARALWRIIDSGYGVCNGIAQVEQYILGKLRY